MGTIDDQCTLDGFHAYELFEFKLFVNSCNNFMIISN